MTSPDIAAPAAKKSGAVSHAGLALQAQDTGRVLMLQRSLADSEDPNAGLWEFPGGGLDDGEDPMAGALREFSEEIGVPVPEDAQEGASWDLPPDAPKYRLHLMTIPSESAIDTNSNEVKNPDDPRGLDPESTAFWDPAHIQGDHIRPEVLDSMPHIKETLDKTPSAGGAKAPTEAVTAAGAAATPPAPPSPAPAEQGDVTDTAKVMDLLEQIQQTSDPDTIKELTADALSILKPTPVEASDSLIASAAPVAPPDEWFEPFDLGGPTPLTVTADGRVYGHLADWNSCHRSGQYSDKCVRPPSDPTAPYFQLGEVMTASGAMVRVGTVTVGGGHADPRLGLVAALEHYDDVSTAAAVVTVQEDEYGIGLFGSVVSDAEPSLVASLRRSPLSGDWRKEKGKWRLIKAHAVNSPGFPLTRGLVASGGDDEADATAFFTTGRVESPEPDPTAGRLNAVVRRLAKSAGLDVQSMVASARAAMADLDCGCDEDSLVASLSGNTDLPVAPYDMAWDGGQAADNVFKWANGDVKKIGEAFLWQTPGEPTDQKQGWDLPFADIVDGELKIVPRAVQAIAGGHGVGQLDGISADDEAAIKSKIGVLYGKVKAVHPDAPDNPFAGGDA